VETPEPTRSEAIAPAANVTSLEAPVDEPSAPISPPTLVDLRTIVIGALAVGIAVAGALAARVLSAAIALITNLAYFHRVSLETVAPSAHRLGVAAVAVPIVGGLVVGVMARYGSPAIRGHGIPEAMERVLLHQSRIPWRLTILKPLSAAIAIGTGGPFGAEGPIIATGAALGSLVGQRIRVTDEERKVLLAAGAAAGMTATFGAPVSAVLLAVELLLFEYHARSLIPVALAATTAHALRVATLGADPVFGHAEISFPHGSAIVVYAAIGIVLGAASIAVTRLVYRIEDAFEHLPLHWMWWPAIGGLAVGLVGLVAPATLGVGYTNIEHALHGDLMWPALAGLALAKLVSWSLSLGSGTSGGTLAPLFTVGGALGAVLVTGAAHLWPTAGLDPRLGALIGMAAIFAGASRALFASVVFALECTHQIEGLAPLLGACTSAYLVSCLFMPGSIMTEKLFRRGVRVPTFYTSSHSPEPASEAPGSALALDTSAGLAPSVAPAPDSPSS
jgi:H+/Cl- antiporter ClcA